MKPLGLGPKVFMVSRLKKIGMDAHKRGSCSKHTNLSVRNTCLAVGYLTREIA